MVSLGQVRRGWERIRPFPLPRYASGTPIIGADQQPRLVQFPNAMTFAAAATSGEANQFVASIMEKLSPSATAEGQYAYYRLSQGQFGEYWRYADLPTALWAAATLIDPTSYLEIGVRRGRSAAVLAAIRPDCAIYGFDLWVDDYAGDPNPGPDFVREELRKVGHRGSVELVSGDSKDTVPAFLREHPTLYFDVITVDGDHSLIGAATDIANALPRLKVGGILLFDDIARARILKRVWAKAVKRDSRFVTWEFTDVGYGIGAAIRIGDKPLLVAMRPR
ncbi:MAG: class I SAM-dependent methyltransferase [Dehalococcoidia bacterium]